MKHTLRILAASLFAVGLASCGGSNSVSNNPSGITAVRVFGDSIADSGTFGFKFTVNNAGVNGTATPIWTELVANSLGLGLTSVCPYFSIGASGVTANAGCKSAAVGGGRINNKTNGTASQAGDSTPWSIPYQMDVAALAAGGTFAASELIVLDGGGNDSADVIGAYLGAGTQAGLATYMGLLSTLLPPATVNATIALPATATNPLNGAQQLGGMYMVALANKMADDINSKLLARGATKVALVNAPAVTNTPRFKSVLQNVAANAGAPAAAGIEALSRGWTQAFNSTLQTRLGSEPRVAIVDLATDFDNQVNNPAQFGLANPMSTLTGVVDTACPVTGLDSSGLPAYNFVTCTAAALDAIPAKVAVWRKQSFSDGFHPTPYGHELAAQLVKRTLQPKGWM